jgi:hypothetical protein
MLALARRAAAFALASVGTLTVAHAQEAYLRAGLPGLGIGYAHALGPSFGLRAEYSTLGTRSTSGTREGVNFDATIKADQAGVYGDWFPAAGGFRLSAGVSSNTVRFSGNARANANGTVTINNTSVPFGAGDSYAVEVRYPGVTPYLGLGWGHQATQRGWGLVADAGVYVGRFKASSTASPGLVAKLNAAGANAQAEIDAQTRKVQDSLDRMPVLPVLAIGVSYRW